MKYTPLTDAEISASEQRGLERDRTSPRIVAAAYDKITGALALTFMDGQTVTAPARSLPGLADATDAQLSDLAPGERGHALFFDELDQQYSTIALIRFIFKLPSQVESARKAGRAKTEKKAISSRANGAKGGRPPKIKTVPIMPS